MNQPRESLLFCCVLGVFGLGLLTACGGAPKGAIREVDAPSWFEEQKKDGFCAKGSARVKGTSQQARTEATAQARLALQTSIQDVLKNEFLATTKGGETQVAGSLGLAQEGAVEDTIQRYGKFVANFMPVDKSEFVRQTDGYVQPGDMAFSRVCLDTAKVQAQLEASSQLDEVYRERLKRATKMLSDARARMDAIE